MAGTVTSLEGHELGRVFRHAGTKGRRDHAFASCACGATLVGRTAAVLAGKHAEHLARIAELDDLKPYRSDPRWIRLREACCEIVGSGDVELDEYVDVVYFRLIPNTKRPPASLTLEGGTTPAAGR